MIVGETSGHTATLLIYKCESHGKLGTLPEPENVEVKFLPKNTTSETQRLDAGIITAIKRHYTKRHIDNAINLLDCDAVNKLQGMVWMRADWNHLSSDIIKNFRRHTGLLGKNENFLIDLTPSGMANVEEE